MAFGNPGTILINELKHSEIKPYNYSIVKETMHENEILQTEMDNLKRLSETKEVTTEVSINFMILKKFFERNERIVKAYNYIRQTRIANCILENDENFKKVQYTPSSQGCNSFTGNSILSSNENEFMSIYKETLDFYKNEFEFLDFEVSEPPLDFFITVVTIDDCGVLLNGDEVIELKKNKMYYLKKKSVQHLIESGRVVIIK